MAKLFNLEALVKKHLPKNIQVTRIHKLDPISKHSKPNTREVRFLTSKILQSKNEEI